MEEYLRQLTHDNELFEKSWPSTFNQLSQLSQNVSDVDEVSFKVNALNGLVDYLLADHEPMAISKVTFIEVMMNKVLGDPQPSLDELVSIFCRVLEVDDVNDEYNVIFLRKFFYHFSFGERLSALPSVNLIESIFTCLLKHPYRNEDFKDNMQEKWEELLARGLFSPISSRNKLNNDQTIIHMQSQFQQFYR